MTELRPLDSGTLNVAVDMQRMFAEATEWQVKGFGRLIQPIVRLCQAHPDATLFTRFVTPRTPAEAPGEWRRYYERWRSLTRDEMGEEMLDIVPELHRFVPPARVIDKHSYGGFASPAFTHALQEREVGTLVLSGVETDVCVLSTALQAIDRGWRVVIVEDGVAGSAPEHHEAALNLFRGRFGCQIEIAPTETILAAWR
jgi:nicotinamidase-related amidase